MQTAKEAVRDFWNAGSCEESWAVGKDVREGLEHQAKTRYEIMPYLQELARFGEGRGRDVLEIGVGMGADHLCWARACPRRLVGIDLTERAVEFTRGRMRMNGFEPEVNVGDAENLSFPDESFDIVWSWGVLHHTPDTARAIREVHRVLRPGGSARIMIYHTPSIVSLLLWLRYGLMTGKSMNATYALLESPGTKGYTTEGAQELFCEFRNVRTRICLGHGDLLMCEAGARHGGKLLPLVRKIWPRWFIKTFMKRLGNGLLIEATK